MGNISLWFALMTSNYSAKTHYGKDKHKTVIGCQDGGYFKTECWENEIWVHVWWTECRHNCSYVAIMSEGANKYTEIVDRFKHFGMHEGAASKLNYATLPNLVYCQKHKNQEVLKYKYSVLCVCVCACVHWVFWHIYGGCWWAGCRGRWLDITWRKSVVTGGWRKWQDEEPHDLCSSPTNIRAIKSRRTRGAGHVARVEEKRHTCNILRGKTEGRDQLWDLDVMGG